MTTFYKATSLLLFSCLILGCHSNVGSSYRNPEGGGFLDSDNTLVEYGHGDFTAQTDWTRSYYTTETEAELFALVNYKSTLDIEIKDSAGKVVYQKANIQLPQIENRWQVDLTKFGFGEYATEVTIDAGDHGVITKQLKLIKLPSLSPGNEVKIDKFNRSVLVNGSPTFVFGSVTMASNGHYKEGYNTFFRWTNYASASGAMTPTQAAQTDTFLSENDRLGLWTIDNMQNVRNWDAFWDPADTAFWEDVMTHDIPDILKVIKHDPTLIAIKGLDEPEIGDRLDLARDINRVIHEQDPYHPTLTTFAYGQGINEAQTEFDDIIMAYIYWLPDFRAAKVDMYAEQVGTFAKSVNKPFWAMPKTEDKTMASPIPMTPAEQFVNTYIMLLNGATGLTYFVAPNIHLATVQTMQTLAEEMDTLAPALLVRPPTYTVTLKDTLEVNAAVHMGLRVMPDGTPVLILANFKEHGVGLKVRMPWLGSGTTLKRLTHRGLNNVALIDQAFSEDLEALATRAYKFEGHHIDDPYTILNLEVTETHPADEHKVVNLVENADFEEQGWWDLRHDHIAYDSSIAYSGTTSLKFPHTTQTAASLLAMSPALPLKAYHHYELRVRVRSDSSIAPTDLPPAGGRVVIVNTTEGGLQMGAGLEIPNTVGNKWSVLRKDISTQDTPFEVAIHVVDTLDRKDFWIDHVELADLGPYLPQLVSTNHVPNSSFEYTRLDGWPDYWRPGFYDPWGRNETFLGEPDAPFRADTDNPYHGQVSLRFDGSGKIWWGEDYIRSAPEPAPWAGIRADAGKNHTLSMYMRAAHADTPVTVVAKEIGQQTFLVGTTWARYTLSGAKIGTSDYTALTFTCGEVFWLDAVQLEDGTTATAYVVDGYVPSYRD